MRVGLALPRHVGAILEAEAPRHGHEVAFLVASRVELLLALREGSAPEVLVVAATEELLDAGVVEEADVLGIRILAIAAERRDRTAERFGVAVAPAGADWPTIDAILLAGAGAAPPADRGALVAVWGPHGAPGRTTIAISLAAALAGSTGSALLVDADTRAAAVAIALGLLDEAAGVAGACRLAATGGLDASELARLSTRVPGVDGGLPALTGIARPERWPELSAERLAGVFEACRAWRAVTVVDLAADLERDEAIMSDALAPRRSAAGLTALAEADAVVLVGAADPVGVARMVDAAATLGEASTAVVVPVVNRVRTAAIGPDGRRQLVGALERFGGIRDPILVPLDQAAADRAMRTALPLPVAAPRSRASAAIARIAAAVLGALDPAGELAPASR